MKIVRLLSIVILLIITKNSLSAAAAPDDDREEVVRVKVGKDGQYRASPRVYERSYESLREHVSSTVRAAGTYNLLELGCGSPESSAALSLIREFCVEEEFSGRINATLVDCSPVCIRELTEYTEEQGLESHVKIILGKLPCVFFEKRDLLSSESFNGIYASYVLHFLTPDEYTKSISYIYPLLTGKESNPGRFFYTGRSTRDSMAYLGVYSHLERLRPKWGKKYPRLNIIRERVNPLVKEELETIWFGYIFDPLYFSVNSALARKGVSTVFCDMSVEKITYLCSLLGFKTVECTDVVSSKVIVENANEQNWKQVFIYTSGVFEKSPDLYSIEKLKVALKSVRLINKIKKSIESNKEFQILAEKLATTMLEDRVKETSPPPAETSEASASASSSTSKE